MDYIGIDVHKAGTQICILAEGGEVMDSASAPSPSASPPCSGPGPAPGS